MALLSNLFGNQGEAHVRAARRVAETVNQHETTARSLTDAQLPEKLSAYRQRHVGGESLDALLPEVFALVREAARRTLQERPFDVQIMGGIALHQGSIAEMKTGEGKTLVATMPVVLNALSGQGVHVVTVNEYLAQRDAKWMSAVYGTLGLTVGVSLHAQSTEEKRAAYTADITYGTNNEFGFDYLRDHMVYRSTDRVQRGLHYAIVDEVDSILIDEARTPLIISAPDEESTKHYAQFAQLVPKLERETHYVVDEKQRAVTLTDEGISRMEQLLNLPDLYASGDIRLIHHLEQALRAQTLFRRDVDYVVKDGEIIIVDAFTGRLMPGRRYSEGLHQAIEAKEGVKVQAESRTMATITFQNYFRLYKKLSGMTGTAYTSREEFQKVYNLDVRVIPTNRPMVRADKPDRIYATELAKFRAVTREVRERHTKGQPVLVGTIAIEKSELLSDMLRREGIPHEVLNAKQHDREAQIVAQAGQKDAETISTNMAGRGTDIKLGEGVQSLGGLFVLGTERHEARRIDNQLRGRSGRQGDPGESQFFISLEDDIMRIFGGERLKRMLSTLKVPEDEPIESGMVSRAVEAAQAKVEGFYFDSRKHVLEYDDVMNKQRAGFYQLRDAMVDARADLRRFKEETLSILLEALKQSVTEARTTAEAGADLDALSRAAVDRYVNTTEEEWKSIRVTLPPEAAPELPEATREALRAFTEKRFDAKAAELTPEILADVVQILLLQTLDLLWTDHLDTMEYLRTGIGLRGYGQRDPLVEYRQESHQLYRTLLSHFRHEAATAFFHMTVHARTAPTATRVPTPPLIEQHPNAARPIQELAENGEAPPAPAGVPRQPATASGTPMKRSLVGRNDPCPCGSGKKYKKCHGAGA